MAESKVASFTIAVSRSWKDKSGRKGRKQQDYIQVCGVWEQQEIVSSYTSKGSRIAVDGELREEKYTSQSGEKKSSWVVHVNNVVCLKRGRESTATELMPVRRSFNLDF